jgi:hypothetical protein
MRFAATIPSAPLEFSAFDPAREAPVVKCSEKACVLPAIKSGKCSRHTIAGQDTLQQIDAENIKMLTDYQWGYRDPEGWDGE